MENNASEDRVLITGGHGCIGSATAQWLLQHYSCHLVICARHNDSARSRAVFGQIDPARMTFVHGDVRDQPRMQAILHEQQVTHVVHLAGLQTPECNANRDFGLQVNLAGTQNLIEAIKVAAPKLKRFVFASSMAVYGPRSLYPPGTVPMNSPLQPVNAYGTWKLAGEQLTRLLHVESDIDTISLRPGALFGPGRDAGLTATPTTAMKHVARGVPYEIPFFNPQDYQYVPDVGAAFGNAVLEPFSGCASFTLPGHCLATQQLVDEMRSAAVELGISDTFQITVGSETVPFICEIDSQPFLNAFPKTQTTSVRQAILDSIEFFLKQSRRE